MRPATSEVPPERPSALKRYSATTLLDVWQEADQLPRASGIPLLVQHVSRCFYSLKGEPLQFALNVITASLLVFLLSLLLWFFDVVEGVGRVQGQLATVTVFLQEETLPEEIDELKEALLADPSVAEVSFVSKEEAFAEFRESLGEGASALDGLEGENPLPSSLRISMHEREDLELGLSTLASRLRTHPTVLEVQYPEELVRRVFRLFNSFRMIGIAVAVGLALLVGYLVASTIRLTVFARKREIEIMDLVGATPEYVRAPFLVEGVLIAFCGAVIGISLLFFTAAAIVPLIPEEISLLVGLDLEKSGISLFSVVLVSAVVFASSICGSWLSVRNFQRSR